MDIFDKKKDFQFSSLDFDRQVICLITHMRDPATVPAVYLLTSHVFIICIVTFYLPEPITIIFIFGNSRDIPRFVHSVGYQQARPRIKRKQSTLSPSPTPDAGDKDASVLVRVWL